MAQQGAKVIPLFHPNLGITRTNRRNFYENTNLSSLEAEVSVPSPFVADIRRGQVSINNPIDSEPFRR